jgi:hypothetical protein
VLAAAAFQAASTLALWAVELTCDRRAARAEGRDDAARGLAYIAAVLAGRRTAGWRGLAGTILDYVPGTSHPPTWLRRTLTCRAR